MKDRKQNEFWQETEKLFEAWTQGLYRTLDNPAALDTILYVIKNPGCKKHDIANDLANKYGVSYINQTYYELKALNYMLPLPLIRENEDGSLEFLRHSSAELQFFALLYENFGEKINEDTLNKLVATSELLITPADPRSKLNYERMSDEEKKQMYVKIGKHMHKMFHDIIVEETAEMKSTLQEIGKHLRWMPKAEEEKILKESANKVYTHLSNLQSLLYFPIKDTYEKVPFSIGEYVDTKELRKKFSMDESRFLWDICWRVDISDELSKYIANVRSDIGYRNILEFSGQVYGVSMIFPDIIEIAAKKSEEFTERLVRVTKGKHYFTPEELARRSVREKAHQKLFRPKYSESAVKVAQKLLDSSDKIKREIIEIAKTQKSAYDRLPVGTL